MFYHLPLLYQAVDMNCLFKVNHLSFPCPYRGSLWPKSHTRFSNSPLSFPRQVTLNTRHYQATRSWTYLDAPYSQSLTKLLFLDKVFSLPGPLYSPHTLAHTRARIHLITSMMSLLLSLVHTYIYSLIFTTYYHHLNPFTPKSQHPNQTVSQ